MAVTLRPYQQKLIDDIESAWAGGARNVLAVMPTRSGKTVTFSAMNNDGAPSCTIVHRQELVGQISLTYARTGIYHNIVAPQPVINFCIAQHVKATGRSYYDPKAPAHIAGVDTLIRRFDASDRWCRMVQRWTTDEAHHVTAANKWGTAAALFTNAKGLGVTATPVRADRKSLHADQGGVFRALVEGPGMRDLINAGNVCDYRVIAPQSGIDEALLKIGSTGDFTAASTRKAQRSEMVGDVVQTYRERVPGSQAIVFCVDVKQSEDVAAQFNAAGVPAAALSAKSTDADRAAQVQAFAEGRLRVLSNVDLFGEGFDVPACDVVIMARPTMSFGLFCQQFARCLTPAEGKTHGTIIDHVGNVVRMAATHGMPDTPQNWKLWQDERRGSGKANPDAIPVRICATCALTYEAIRTECPFCGAAHVPEGRGTPAQVDGMLAEMSPELLAQLRMAKAAVDRDTPAIPIGADPRTVAAINARHRNAQSARRSLIEVMEAWGGMQLANGDNDAAMQARFYHRFGIDVLTAQTLNERKALELSDAIRKVLT